MNIPGAEPLSEADIELLESGQIPTTARGLRRPDHHILAAYLAAKTSPRYHAQHILQQIQSQPQL